MAHSTWQATTLGEVLELKRGYDLPARDRRDGPFPIVSSSGVSGYHARAMAKAPGVVTGRYGTLGQVFFIEKDYWPLNTSLYVRDFKGNDPRFVSYFLKTLDFMAYSDKAAVPGLNRNHLHMASVEVPPLPEQRAIAGVLGALDDKIEVNRKTARVLEGIARAVFTSWFVDFDPVRYNIRQREHAALGRAGRFISTGDDLTISDPSGKVIHRGGDAMYGPIAHLFPDRLVDSPLGEVPEGWRVGTLGDLIDTVKGRSYKSEELVPSETALVTLKSFARGGGYRPDGLKAYSGTYKPEQVVKPGELVVSCTDVTQAAEVIGRPAIVRASREFKTLVASLDTLIIRPRDGAVTRAFLYFLGGTDAFVAHTYAHTTGTTVLHLAKQAVPSFQFPLPPVELVRQFDGLASPVLERLQGLADESEVLAALRDALLPKLISGELRIADAERIVGRAV